MSSKHRATSLRKTPAPSNENVSYSEPVILEETNDKKQTLQATFITRNGKKKVHFHIKDYHKRILGQPEFYNQTRLSESSATVLVKSLKEQFSLAQEDGSGDYLLLRLDPKIAKNKDRYAEQLAQALLGAISDQDILGYLAKRELGHVLRQALNGAMRRSELENALEQLRHKLDSGEVDEEVYQDWCCKHTWAFGNYYVARDHLRRIAANDLVDLLLEPITGYRDIIELKRPDVNVIHQDKGRKHYYFTSDVSNAIGQCHRYLEVFVREGGDGLIDERNIVALHPRATIVIGRSHEWDDDKRRALHGLNSRLHNISVMTYDQLLAQGEVALRLLTARDSKEPEVAEHITPPKFI